jgi:translation initiation factor 1
MPFTIGGEWIPEPSLSQPKDKVKVIKEKRRGSFVTVIINLPHSPAEMKKLCSEMKHRLGCGGSVKDGRIELQGDQTGHVKEFLH